MEPSHDIIDHTVGPPEPILPNIFGNSPRASRTEPGHVSAIPGEIDVSEQPPMTVPLRHILVGLGFLCLGNLTGVGVALGLLPSSASLAHFHLLLVGWICITIMGAMTQFVPVWSGVSLHSRRLASMQLWLVAGGLLGFAGGVLTGQVPWLPVAGGLMLVGFWTFAYNVGRTLGAAGPCDTTERHFALSLGFFVLLSGAGLVLASDLVWPVIDPLLITRSGLIGAHATFAVFGAVLTTLFGALYQLGPMFTQTDLHGMDVPLRRLEEVGYPIGVISLALGRLFGHRAAAVLGGLLIMTAMVSVGLIVARRLFETHVEWTPMLSRYGVLAVAMCAWAALSVRAWIRDPIGEPARLGAPGTAHLLILGVLGFAVLGTLYHIVPFIVWVHRYSDRLGYEPVPMVDELYSDRLARLDFWCFVAGTVLVVGADLGRLGSPASVVGGALLVAGSGAFTWNMLRVIRDHSPYTLRSICWAASAAQSRR
jgi:hypothetical protein